MKKICLTICAIAATVAAVSSCKNDKKTQSDNKPKVEIPAGSIVFFDLDRVFAEYKMAIDLRKKVEAKVEVIQKDIDRRQRNLENSAKDFQNKINKGLMTTAVANEQAKRLDQQQKTFQEYAQQRQAEIMEEQQVMMNQIGDAIKTFLEEYNLDKDYSLILSNQASVPVVVGDTTLNITDDVIEGLNAKYELEKPDSED